MEISTKFTVNHDAAKVFAFLNDHENQMTWVPNLTSVSPIVGDPTKKGSKYTMVMKEGSKHTEYDVTTLDLIPSKLIHIKMDSWGCGKTIQKGTPPTMEMTAAYALKPTGKSTEITMTYGVDMSKAGFFMKLIAPLGKLIAKSFMGKFRKAIVRELDRYQPK